jgi:hypothetical protein
MKSAAQIDRLAAMLASSMGPFSLEQPPPLAAIEAVMAASSKLKAAWLRAEGDKLRESCATTAQTPCFVSKSGVALVPDTIFCVLSFLDPRSLSRVNRSSKDLKSFTDQPRCWSSLTLRMANFTAAKVFYQQPHSAKFRLIEEIKLPALKVTAQFFPLIFFNHPSLRSIDMSSLKGLSHRGITATLIKACPDPTLLKSLSLPCAFPPPPTPPPPR